MNGERSHHEVVKFALDAHHNVPIGSRCQSSPDDPGDKSRPLVAGSSLGCSQWAIGRRSLCLI